MRRRGRSRCGVSQRDRLLRGNCDSQTARKRHVCSESSFRSTTTIIHPPHFHVRYAEQKATVGLESLTILEGRLKQPVLGLVVEWAASRRTQLMEDWDLARRQQ